MRRPATLLLAAAITVALAGCKPAPAPAADAGTAAATPAAAADTAQADAKFADLSKRWLDGMLALSPVSATQIGDHRFDGEVDDMSSAGRAKSLDFPRKMPAKLEAMDPRLLQVVQLRFFTGLTVEETADALQISAKTVKRDWSLARVWLEKELAGAAGA